MRGFTAALQGMKGGDEWYTPANAVEVIVPYLRKFKTIWCPFDTAESNYVKVLTAAGFNVIHSHIFDGQDFFNYEPDQPYDAVVSNPPFSLRTEIYTRLFQLGKPWAMIGNANGLWDAKQRFALFREHGIEIFVINGRTKFFGPQGNGTLQPPFQSLYICHGVLPRPICYEGESQLTLRGF